MRDIHGHIAGDCRKCGKHSEWGWLVDWVDEASKTIHVKSIYVCDDCYQNQFVGVQEPRGAIGSPRRVVADVPARTPRSPRSAASKGKALKTKGKRDVSGKR